MSQGSGWVAGSRRCATRVCIRIVVTSLVHTLRKSHHVLQPSWWNSNVNGAPPELIPCDAYPRTRVQSTAAFCAALRAKYARFRAAIVFAILTISAFEYCEVVKPKYLPGTANVLAVASAIASSNLAAAESRTAAAGENCSVFRSVL